MDAIAHVLDLSLGDMREQRQRQELPGRLFRDHQRLLGEASVGGLQVARNRVVDSRAHPITTQLLLHRVSLGNEHHVLVVGA